MTTSDVPPLSIGQIVHLNSGSPAMTVVSCDQDQATVKWFDGNDVYENTFPRASLKFPQNKEETA